MNSHFNLVLPVFAGRQPQSVGQYKDRRPKAALNQSGFSLIEVLLVMALMAIVIGVVPFYISGRMPSARLKSEARVLSSAIRQARAVSLIKGKETTFTVDMDSSSYWISNKKPRPLPEGIGIKVVDPIAGDIVQGKWRMTFETDGLTAGGTLVLFNDTRAVKVVVDPLTSQAVVKTQ